MSAVDEGRESLDRLVKDVSRRGYDCDCQKGGVDAMSIDTDYLRHNLENVVKAFAVMDAATPEKSLTESDEFVRMTNLVEGIDAYATRWADPTSYVHTHHDKTFFARLIQEWIGSLHA